MDKFDLSAEDLELFTVEPKLLAGSRRAARSISKALNKVPTRVGLKVAKGHKVSNAIHETLNEVVLPVLRRNRKYGAADTEPETNITIRMERHFGVELDRFEWTF